MILGIDHVAIAVLDPEAAIEGFAIALGVRAGASGGRHPGWGTRNRLLWLGDTYIELCTVDDPALARSSWLGRPALAALPGPRAICWALSSDDIDSDRADMNARGAELGTPVPGERRRPDGQIVRWKLALPAEVALDRPFLIEHDTTAAEWSEADRAERAALAGRLTAVELPVVAIEGLAPGQYGDQRVGTLDDSSGVPTIRVAGAARRDPVSMLGCLWILE